LIYEKILRAAQTDWSEALDNKRFPHVREVFSHFLVYFCLTTVAIAQPLLQLYGGGLAAFSAANIEGNAILLFAFLVLLSPPLVLLVGEIALGAFFPSRQELIHRFMVASSFFLVSLLFFRSIPIASWSVALLFHSLISAFLTYVFFAKQQVASWIKLMSPVGGAVLIVFVVSARGLIWVPEIGAAEIESNIAPEVVIGTERSDISVALLVLDELPLFALLGPNGTINAERFPGFAELAKVSTWYRNDVATSQTTTAAVPSILTGRFPENNEDPPLLVNHPKNLFTLLGGSVSLDVRETVTSMCPRKLCSKAAVLSEPESEPYSEPESEPYSEPYSEAVVGSEDTDRSGLTSAFLRDALVVLGHKLLPTQLREKLPSIDDAWGGFTGSGATGIPAVIETPASSTTVKLEDVNTPDEVTDDLHADGPPKQVEDTRLFIERVTRSDVPSLHFLHTLLPHRPWSLTADMRTFQNLGLNREIPNDRFSSINEIRVFLQQLIATDSLILDLVTKLKRSANWNRTMLVITADHGMTLEAGAWKRKMVDSSKPGTLEDLYRVPLFIKYPDQVVGEINDCTSSPVDILPTIASVKGISAGWTYDGDDLRTRCIDRPERVALWPGGENIITSGVEALQKRADYYSTLVPYEGGIEGASSIAPYGALTNLMVPQTVSREDRVLQWSIDQAEQLVNVQSTEFAKIPLEVSGTIVLKNDLPNDAMGLLLIDGKVSGMIAEIGGKKAGAAVAFRSMLTASSLDAGDHVAELAIVTGGPRDPVITFVGLPS
jgi:hypothetical protein